ncbi:hypothetical protein Tsubulata_038087 [Turnera subulata]|uniref:Laccase n=1 Tax=Turnera subulata TaxID=218843 RepID=A0A9Q0JPL8_9ROSI|nr:hypothetical protein Tsubulata_038087 [Turnera subulata]
MSAQNSVFQMLCVLLFFSLVQYCSPAAHYHFRVKEAPYTRLCSTKKILTINGQFPGPTLHAHQGETIYVTVHNDGRYNITIHWHGVKLPRYPWSDGPEYITQCPIRPGGTFKEKIIFSTEVGTLWWHAHSDWSRATVHGAIFVYPKNGTGYPFAQPHMQVPIILGEWWKRDVMEVLMESRMTGGEPNISDAFTVNGQPGDLYPCSKPGTFKLSVEPGKFYLLRIVNAALNNILFFSIARHDLTVVGVDGEYTKPLTREIIAISPGQTMDALLHANQNPDHYYIAARSYTSSSSVSFDNTTTTGIVQYSTGDNYTSSSPPSLPQLPPYNDTIAAFSFLGSLRSLGNHPLPYDVPLNVTTKVISTVSINTFPCSDQNRSCEGPNGTIFAASMNNISFVDPWTDILRAYYNNNNRGVYGTNFPSFPPLDFDFTASDLPLALQTPKRGTEVKILPYNSTVEIVLQGTNLVAGIDHPMHLHGYSFFVVGWGFGNFDKDKDPKQFNLVDPPLVSTVTVPKNGWVVIRFKAINPGN